VCRGQPVWPGRPGSRGVQGVQGVQGVSGPAWLYQPSPAELVANVREAASEISLRTVLDPRVGARYLTALTSRLVKLPGGLLLRAIITTDNVVPGPEERSNVRSIA